VVSRLRSANAAKIRPDEVSSFYHDVKLEGWGVVMPFYIKVSMKRR